MLQGGDENALLKTGEECEKQKPRKLSGERSGAKSGSAVTPSRKTVCFFFCVNLSVGI